MYGGVKRNGIRTSHGTYRNNIRSFKYGMKYTPDQVEEGSIYLVEALEAVTTYINKCKGRELYKDIFEEIKS